MPPLPIILVIVSTFMHAAWNLSAKGMAVRLTGSLILTAGLVMIALKG